MNKILTTLAATAFASALVGCDGDDVDGYTPPSSGSVRAIHAVVDAPAVNIALTGSGSVVSGLDYSESTGYVSANTPASGVTVDAVLPGGADPLEDIITADVNFTEGDRLTFMAVGTVDPDDTANLQALVIPDPAEAPSSTEVALTVVHAAPGVQSVDVYITAPGAAISGEPAISGFAYTNVVDAGLLSIADADEIQIQVTLEGDPATIAYRSGTLDLNDFAGTSLIVAATIPSNDTQAAASPIQLFLYTDLAGTVALDQETDAGVRVVHVSPDAGAVDVEVNGDVAFPAVDYLRVNPTTLDPGVYALNLISEGTDVFDEDVMATLSAGVEYSIFALGLNAPGDGEPELALGVTVNGDLAVAAIDDNRAIATQASLKVVHGAPAVGNVNVYVTEAGSLTVAAIEDLTATEPPAPLLSGVAFRAISGYSAVAPGSYDVRVAQVTTDDDGEVTDITVVIDSEGVELEGGDVITAVAHQADGVDGDPATPGLLLLTNQPVDL